jgi:hypothetical protein
VKKLSRKPLCPVGTTAAIVSKNEAAFVFTKFDHLIRFPLHSYEFMFPMPQAGVPAGTNQERNLGACQGIP